MAKQFKIILGLFVVFSATTQCASLSSKNVEEIHNPILTLRGKWRQVQPIVTQKDYLVEFNPQFFIFYVGGEVPVKKYFHLNGQHIVSRSHEVTQISDTIRFELPHKDTLILDLKESGKTIKVKHYRIEGEQLIKH